MKTPEQKQAFKDRMAAAKAAKKSTAPATLPTQTTVVKKRKPTAPASVAAKTVPNKAAPVADDSDDDGVDDEGFFNPFARSKK